MVALGVATGLAQDVQLKPAAGDHTNDPLLPLALSVALAPGQTVALFPVFTEGEFPGVIDMVPVAVPQLLVTVSV